MKLSKSDSFVHKIDKRRLFLLYSGRVSEKTVKGVLMVKKSVGSIIVFCIVSILLAPGCRFFKKKTGRETIIDKVVSIPSKILEVPDVPSHCNEIEGLKKGFVDAHNGKLYYEEEGAGIPLVLINGGPGGTHHGFHPYFSQIKDVARVIYYDQRGTGKSSSDHTGKTYTVKQAVEDLENLRKGLKIDRWVVLGHSYGGLLAQCYALTYPESCMGIVLVASTGTLWKSWPDRAREFISQAEYDAISAIYSKAAAGKFKSDAQVGYNLFLAGNWKRICYTKPTKKELARVASYGFKKAPGFEELMRLEVDEIDLKGKFDDCTIPTLITEAKYDFQFSETDRVQTMCTYHPNAQIEVFEKSGHIMFADEPEKFFSLLRGFLKKASETKVKTMSPKSIAWPKEPSQAGRTLAN